jgi:hypothetical protein
MRRVTLVQWLIELIGTNIRLIELGTGWPSVVGATMALGEVPLALFVASVELSHRDRDDTERRLQNPGTARPIIVPPSTLPIVLGVWHHDDLVAVRQPVLMAADAWKREGRMSRHSVFVQLDSLQRAEEIGWDERENTEGETIACFLPGNFGKFVEESALKAVEQPVGRLEHASQVLSNVATDAERARRAATLLVRAAQFGSTVIRAYGERCALCNIDLKLVQGAHIHPVAAGTSNDDVSNGVCLCANHHLAFDRHYIHIEPSTRQVTLHPWLRKQSEGDEVATAFLEGTRKTLRDPDRPADRPTDDAFRLRYSYFGESYNWALPDDPEESPPD